MPRYDKTRNRMSFDSVSEGSASNEVSTSQSNGKSKNRQSDTMNVSPGSSPVRPQKSSHKDRRGSPSRSPSRHRSSNQGGSSRKSKKKDRSRTPSCTPPFHRGRDRESSKRRHDRSNDRRDRKRSRSDSRRDRKSDRSKRRNRSRSPQKTSSSRYKRQNRRARSSSASSDDEKLGSTSLISEIINTHKDVAKVYGNGSKKKRRRSSTSSSSSDATQTQKRNLNTAPILPGGVPVVPEYPQPPPNMYGVPYMTTQSGLVIPTPVPPPQAVGGMPSNIMMPPPPPLPPMPPDLFAPPPVPPPQPMYNPAFFASMPPPMIPPLPPTSIPVPMPPMAPAQPSTSGTGMQPMPLSVPPPQGNGHMPPLPGSSRSDTSALPMPNVNNFGPKKRGYDRPVVLDKTSYVGKEWGNSHFSRFEIVTQVGEGTYGQVYKAVDKENNDERVALKKVRLENEKDGFPITAVREVKILRQLNHKNVVRLIDIVADKGTPNELRKERVNFYLVFEYVDHDLMGLLEAQTLVEFTPHDIQILFKQLLQGLEYCHNANFLHRDIKCSNILLNNRGELKIADFGLARLFYEDQERPYTNRVITLWYRPPELLLGEEHYGPPIDVWSVGCILGEFFTRKPLFQGTNEINQLELITRLCGSPTPDVWPDVVNLPQYNVMKPRRIQQRILAQEFQMLMPREAVDLMDRLLTLDPKRRMSAKEALSHSWMRNVDPTERLHLTLPKNQDCHEMWSKKQRKERRSNAPLPPMPRMPVPAAAAAAPVPDRPRYDGESLRRVIERYLRDPRESNEMRNVIRSISEEQARDVFNALRQAGAIARDANRDYSYRDQILSIIDAGIPHGGPPTIQHRPPPQAQYAHHQVPQHQQPYHYPSGSNRS